MRVLLLNLFFYGFTLFTAPVCYILVRVSSRVETATMRLIREHAKGAVLAAAEDRHARGVGNED